jgi:hypothetical protein
MKHLLLPGVCLTLLLSCADLFAQTKIPVNEPNHKKPSLFTNLPDRIPVTISDLQSLLNLETGKDARLRLGQTSIAGFEGKVVSTADKYNSIHSVVIRSSNFNGATLTLSSFTQPNGAVKFTGRIISFEHSDLYELQYQNDQYILVKKNFYDLVNE